MERLREHLVRILSMRCITGSSCRAILLVCCLALLSCSSFRIPTNIHRRLPRNVLHSDNNDYLESEQSVQDEIKDIIQIFLTAEGGVSSINPSVLMDNAHILTKGKLYEYVIDKTIEECDNVREVARIEAVDTFMRGFIVSERKQRSRLKMNYMMTGASSNRLDEAITLLSESDEIDESLLNYVDTLIRKEMLRAAGPAATEESEDLLQGVGKDAVGVLRMIKRRLEAEMKTVGRDDLKLLAKLLQENDLEVRESILRNSFGLIEELEEFAVLLSNGITHILATGGVGRSPLVKDSDEVDLPVGTLEKMKDLMVSVEKAASLLETGLRNNDIYSTNAEDYIDVDLNAEKLGDGDYLENENLFREI